MTTAIAHLPLPVAARHGFTLIEVILATAIVAILMGALYTVFHGTMRLRETTYAAVESGLPVDYAARLIRRDLAAALPPGGILAGSFLGVSDSQAAGRMDNLDFFSASGVLTNDQPWANLQEVQYFLEDPNGQSMSMSNTARTAFSQTANSKGMDLVRATRRNLTATVAEDPVEERLLQNVVSLEITYWDGQEWLDDWDSTALSNTIPSAIRFLVAFAAPGSDTGATRRIPPLQVECELLNKPQPGVATPSPTP
jgi:prepilin-type N-terminal cleavage/methylation domain-containing protein